MINMNNIWSENKYVNAAVNVLFFLMGINFLHYGQLILPVICFLLFIDRKLRFEVNSPLTFIVLCLFAVSFYAFSEKNFYSVMGFTLPMAYYIGCNILHPSEENLKKLLYLLGISMAFHVIANSIFEYIVHGPHGFFFSTTHYDFWTREKISNTATAINIDFLLGAVYYLLFHEKDRKFRTFALIVFALSMFYLLVIGRRTPVMMLLLCFGFSFNYEAFVLKSASDNLKKAFFLLMAMGFGFVLLVVLAYSLNVFNCREILMALHVFRKFTDGFINDERFRLLFGAFRLMPEHLFGGQKISGILGEQVHDFWVDIYDYAGIVSWALMLGYSFLFVKDVVRFYRSSKIRNDFKVYMTGILTVIVVQMFLEPVMTGASLFVICGIITHGLMERLVFYEQ